jgi:hypothetical protein
VRVLDLFAGLEGWSAPFRERDHDVISVDIDPRFDVSLCMDVLELSPDDLPWTPDIVLASPPCEGFSVMTIGRSWSKPYPGTPYAHLRAETEPKTETAALGLRLVEKTLELLQVLGPRYFVIENPRAKLRKLGVVAGLDRRTVTYCQYGRPYMKPTDLWGGFPPSLELRPPCSNGDPCHVRAPRGSRTGVQGELAHLAGGSEERKSLSALRAKVPEELALAVCLAAEHDLERGVETVSARLFE